MDLLKNGDFALLLTAGSPSGRGSELVSSCPEESLGTLLGEFEKSIDAFIIVALLCFVIGVAAELCFFVSGKCQAAKFLFWTCQEAKSFTKQFLRDIPKQYKAI